MGGCGKGHRPLSTHLARAFPRLCLFLTPPIPPSGPKQRGPSSVFVVKREPSPAPVSL